MSCAFLTGAVTNASATDCAAFALCDEFERTGAVFVGRVASIVRPRHVGLGPQHVELVVLESFKGPRDPRITVEELGLTDFRVEFVVGETYLVFASKRPGSGGWVTSGCSRTERLATAGKTLAYVRRMARLPPDTRARLNGVVLRDAWPAYGPPSSRLANIRVTLRDGVREYHAVTNSRGEFSMRGIVPGTYLARAEPPARYVAEAPRSVRVWEPDGCGRLSLTLKLDGRVSGRLVFADGRPAAGRPVSLAPDTFVKMLVHRYGDRGWIQSWTDPEGRFELRTVPPGRYLLRLDTVPGDLGRVLFYRGRTFPISDAATATTIKLGDGQRRTLPDIVVPEEPSLVVLTAVIKAADGKPVSGAEVRLTEGTKWIGPISVTGSDGRFTFAATRGRQYTLTARLSRYGINDHRSIAEGRIAFTAAAGVNLELVMKATDP